MGIPRADFRQLEGGVMIYPDTSSAPPPNPDMCKAALEAYREAAGIAGKSPRGAAALLRLALQHIIRTDLGRTEKKIDTAIGAMLAENIIPPEAGQMCDSVRVYGNESVHPGEIDLRDDPETAAALFELVNWIVDDLVSRKKRTSAIFSKLPQNKKDGIEGRNKGAAKKVRQAQAPGDSQPKS